MKIFFTLICAVALVCLLQSCEPLDSDLGNADQDRPDTTAVPQDTTAMANTAKKPTPPVLTPDQSKTLADKVDSLSNALNETNNRVNGLNEEVDAMKDLMQTQQQAPAPSSPQQNNALANPQQEYKTGLDLFFSKQYEESMQTFQSLLDAGKPEDMLSNCQYWVGECSYGMHQYGDALVAFKKVFTYETSTKFDAAQIMIGESELHLGNSAKARTAFRTLLRKYPDSEYAPRAKKILTAMSAE